ncbi:MAG: Asp-tRNA(Asn)/Glu-tRNA(Gln) amidotransferase subunit GatC [Pseudomonadota bacterium]|nr:Asp-tRNA(Asn)/Glu-tRNA(Gln) amidotransferase subunit GatC [Pseudomonadota bacterium]
MSLSPEDVRKIAELARLSVDEEDIPGYARGLSDILDFVRQMNDADTPGVAPMAHPLPMSQPLRTDVVTEENQRDAFQAISPRVERGHFLVPRVIE